jgi:glycosyltransferase involved in cell wall biosynthesis
MNILVLYHGYGNKGGGEKTLYNFLNFSSTYCKINVITINDTKLPLCCKQITLLIKSLKHRHRNRISILFFIFNFIGIFIYIRLLVKNIKKLNPDFIYVHDNFNKALIPIVNLFLNKPLVCHCHDILKGRFTDNYLRIVYRYFFYRIIFPSESSLLSVFNSNFQITKVIRPMPMEIFLPYYGHSNYRQFNFLTVGMLDYVKGHDVVINALAYIQKHYPEYKLTYSIVGSGNEYHNLKSIAANLDLSKAIKFHGYVEDLDNVFQSSHAVIIPSRQESFGLSFMEAALRGIPIIYSDVDALKENSSGFNLIKFCNESHVSCAEAMIDMVNRYTSQVMVGNSFKIYWQIRQIDSNPESFNFLFDKKICAA